MGMARFRDLQRDVDRLRIDIRARFPALTEARRLYFRTRADEDRSRLEQIQSEIDSMSRQIDRCLDEMETTVGLPPGTMERIEARLREERDRGLDQLPRRNLVAEQVPTTSYSSDFSGALHQFTKLLPQGWLEAEALELATLRSLMIPGAFLSLSKGMRRESELANVHRWRQAIKVCSDLQNDEITFDHFAGAALIPMMEQLNRKFEFLRQIPNAQDRLSRLWSGNGLDVDATIFELLVGARCTENGQRVEFISEGTEKSADLRCYDPFPLLLECKRQDALSVYEIAEEQAVRDLFVRLRSEAESMGTVGYFIKDFTVEITKVNVTEVVADLLKHAALSNSDCFGQYVWGRAAFVELVSTFALPEPCRLFSPALLQYTFGWNTDLPEWDGICCSYKNNDEAVLYALERPFGLLWNCTAEGALRKRTWAPLNLFGAALDQITPGDIGVVYITLREGARADVADLRLAALQARLTKWAHIAEIRVPVTFVSRLHARPLSQGAPDLIENTVNFVSDLYGTPELVDEFPSLIFTE
jgi:hypothetical protein